MNSHLIFTIELSVKKRASLGHPKNPIQQVNLIYNLQQQVCLMDFFFGKEASSKPERCRQCKYIFTQNSRRYFCCDKQQLVCEACHAKIECKKCHQTRTKRCVKCSKCRTPCSQLDTFIDFKNDVEGYFCQKCIAQPYIISYQEMVKQNADPNFIFVKLSDKSQYGMIDLINFYKKWCFCCLRQFQKNAYQMKFGARICENCLQQNFDLAMPKLIMCVQCNGYIRDQKQVKFQITATEVLCTYCAMDQAKTYAAHKKKEQAQSSKSVNRSSLKNNGFVIPAQQMSKLKQSQTGQNLPAAMKSIIFKAISRNSVDEEQLNFNINVQKPNCSIFCAICNSLFSLSSVFELNQRDLELFGLDKGSQNRNQSSKICQMCFNQYSSRFQSNFSRRKQFDEIPNFSSNRQLTTKRVDIPSNKSSQQLPASHSPNAKTFSYQIKQSNTLCQICKKVYGSVKIDNILYCKSCEISRVKKVD